MDWVQPVIMGATAVISAAIGATATVLIQRKPTAMSAEAQAQTAVNDGFAKLVTTLSEQLDEARAEMKAAKQELLGEIENLTQHVYSLEKLLRDEGMPVPIRHRPQVITMVPK